jgi:hypothetical protein
VQTELEEIYQALQTSGATRLLTRIDICNAQIAASAVGIFSIYESRLQSRYRWSKPFEEVAKLLLANNGAAEAEQFEVYRLAVNVLKHGVGTSHTKLFERADKLPFKVGRTSGDLHEEGDVNPPSDLIAVSVEFLEKCCDLVEKSWDIVKASEPDPVS